MGTRYDPELWFSIGGEAVAVASAARHRTSNNSMRLRRMESLLRHSTAYQRQQQKRQMTIFYNGQVCVCDATEMQARAIIAMAEKEMEAMIGKQKQMNKHDQQRQEAMVESTTALPLPPSPSPETSPQVLNPGLSMRRSLQRFLEKRKDRISEATPYSYNYKQTPKLLFPLKPQHA
ncbi:protein TIFY 10a-like [Curcuma longa]|uniref:protein TIFY 10a-like n=1 Tax=Curcuma longa TaxID=136217 RepID=UPI003D9EA217